MPTEKASDFFDRIAKRVVSGTAATVTVINDEIADLLVVATPVDTGFARGNWRPSLNVPIESPITFNDPSGQSTVAKIQVVGRRYRVGDTIFIRNNADYITFLNDGSSPQAQGDFVKDAVEQGFDNAIFQLRQLGLLRQRGLGLD